MKDLKNIIIWGALAIYLIVVSGFISGYDQKTLCNSINVVIADSLRFGFVNRSDIMNSISDARNDILGKPISTVNCRDIENMVSANSTLEHVKVFATQNGRLNIEVTQRIPVMRVINRNNQGYYLDYDGNLFPLSKHFSARVLVVNGNIDVPFKVAATRNIYDKYDSNLSLRSRLIYDAHELARFIAEDRFWDAQIVQVYVNGEGEFELVPRVGAHIILLGSAEGYQAKLQKLKTLYTGGFTGPGAGWNDFTQINLKYKDQIICTKR